MAAARELTKLHEEFVRGSISQVKAHFEKTGPRGEFVLVLAGGTSQEPERWSEAEMDLAIRAGLKEGAPSSRLAARLAEESGWKRREIYKRITSGA
jgi:16S rRNA (cytidine1402-2'-O)-methyltransferase